MKQLSGIDATFLYLESASQFSHIAGLYVFDRPTRDSRPYEVWRAQIESRLPLLVPFRRRLREVPARLDHPFWIDDPDVDLDYHVRQATLAPPGTDEQLNELVARLMSGPLDRSRPLWESYVIEGLSGGRFAILTKVHHSEVDGLGLSQLTKLLLEQAPIGDAAPVPPRSWSMARVPSDLEMLGRAALGLVSKSGHLAYEVAQAAWRGLLSSRSPDAEPRSAPRDETSSRRSLSAPPTPFNGHVSPHRRVALRSIAIESVISVKNELGVTLNDVVLAATAAGLREWLLERDALPSDPLRAIIPVSLRRPDERATWSNRLATLSASLPTNVGDSLQRVRFVHEQTEAAKARSGDGPDDAWFDVADLTPPALLAGSARLLDHGPLPANLIVSNIPGPRHPLSLADAPMRDCFVVSNLLYRQGLNVTVQSYNDRLEIALIACPQLVPDVARIADAIVEDLEAMAEAITPTSRRSAEDPPH